MPKTVAERLDTQGVESQDVESQGVESLSVKSRAVVGVGGASGGQAVLPGLARRLVCTLARATLARGPLADRDPVRINLLK